MASASFFNGYNELQKPASRVINPPGGRSNNIFGTDESESSMKNDSLTNAQKPDLTPKQAAVNNKNRNQFGNNIFGGFEQQNETANQQHQQTQQVINRQAVQSAKKRSGYNPITGEEY